MRSIIDGKSSQLRHANFHRPTPRAAGSKDYVAACGEMSSSALLQRLLREEEASEVFEPGQSEQCHPRPS